MLRDMINPGDQTLTIINPTTGHQEHISAHPGCLSELVELVKAHTGTTATALAILMDVVPRVLLMHAEGIIELRD